MKEKLTYKSNDGITNIHATIWIPETEIKAIVQISHGMIEYIERYERFAKMLNKHGILVCGNDHLGHGKSIVDKSHYGYFAEKKGDQVLVNDLYTLTDIVRQKYPDIPYIMLGHSMGSFIVRNYIINYSDHIDGCIIIGSSYKSSLLMMFAKIMAKITALYHHGSMYRSPFLYKCTNGSFNKRFEEGHISPNCWLTTDEEIVNKFSNDPLTQFKFTCNGYYTLYTLIQKACNKTLAKRIRKDLPIFILSGKDDPVGNFGKDIYLIEKEYKKANINNVTIKLYNGMRHELINEKENILPITDVINFVKKIKENK